MAVKVKIPTPLRGLTREQDTVPGEGATLGDWSDHFETEAARSWHGALL